MPATEENDTTDVLVDGKAYPHAHQAIAEGDTDDIAEANGDTPLEDDAYQEGIEGVACGA